jgi:hypothetical protein
VSSFIFSQKTDLRNHLCIIGKTTQNSKVRVPWDEIANDQSKYLSSKYISEGVKIRDPSRMHQGDVEKLLTRFSEDNS